MVKRTTKASSKTLAVLTTRALEHGENAAGASQKKPGFCFTTDDDLAFALGFPYLKFLVDDDQDPRAVAERLLIDGYPYQHVSYGREAAVRLLRALALPGASQLDANGHSIVMPEGIAALDRADPMTPEEARQCVFARVATHPRPFGSMELFIFEALMGPDLVANAIVEGLESIPIARWISHPHYEQESIDALCLLSLRLLPADRDRILARLRDLWIRVASEARQGFDVAAAKADLAVPPEQALGFLYGENPEAWRHELHRRRALQEHIDIVEQNAMNCGFDVVNGAELVNPPRPVVQASPGLVQAARLAGSSRGWYTIPDPRLVFLGGDDVYRVELKHWSGDTHPTPPGEAQRLILERFGRIRSPMTVELVLDMIVRSRAKAQAKAWLLAHLDYAKPVLQSLAKSASGLAKDAADFLGKLPS